MEDHLSEVVPREFLCCPLCKEEYLQPVYLPCLHSFCRACIDDHIEATTTTPRTNATAATAEKTQTDSMVQRIESLLEDTKPRERLGSEPTTFLCPVCATKTVLQEDGATSSDAGQDGDVGNLGNTISPRASLPENVFARRLSCPMTGLGGFKRGGGGGSWKKEEDADQAEDKGIYCTQCTPDLEAEAVAHCLNCDELMCASCSANHLGQAETASHRTQRLDQYRADQETETSQSPRLADQYQQQPPQALPRCCDFYDPLDIGAMFCVDCEAALCAECHSAHHDEHRCAELSAIAQNFENKIKEPLKELKKDRSRLLKALSSLDSARKHSAKTQGGLKRAVKKRTKVLCSLIQDYENAMVLELEKQHGNNISLIQKREDAIKKRIASIEAATEFTEKLLTFGSEEEKVSMRRKIGRRVRELCEEALPSKRVHLSSSTLSEPDVMPETICGMFGELRVAEPSHTSSAAAAAANPSDRKHQMKQSQSIDIGMVSRLRGGRGQSVSSATDEVLPELADLEESQEMDPSKEEGEQQEEEDFLSASNTSDNLRPPTSPLSGSGHSSTSSFRLGSSNTSDLFRQQGLQRHDSSNSGSFRKDSTSTKHDPQQQQQDVGNNACGSSKHHDGCGNFSVHIDAARDTMRDNNDTGHRDSMSRSHSSKDKSLKLDLSSGHLEVPGLSQMDSSFQSGTSHEDVPCYNLETPRREVTLPEAVLRDPVKGVGVNPHGDFVVGTVSPQGKSNIFILEKHGIVRGQIPVERNWSLHSVAADGKISLVVTRGENRYKVKVMSGENIHDVITDVHIESFGLSSVTASKDGKLLVAATRYATPSTVLGRSGAKPGGNITIYDRAGAIQFVITNETFSKLGMYLFDRPMHVSVDSKGNFFVADPGRHSVVGLTTAGEFLFEHGNSDAEEELYQGPDTVSPDRHGNLIVFDKKDGRIDILSCEGVLQRCYFPSEHVRFVSPTPDGMLLLVNSEGELKFFDYMAP